MLGVMEAMDTVEVVEEELMDTRQVMEVMMVEMENILHSQVRVVRVVESM